MEPWIILAMVGALFQLLRNIVMKRLGDALDENINVWGRFTFLLPFTGAAVLWNGVPPLGQGFWWWCLAFGVSQNLATLSLSRALKHSDISLVTSLWKVSLLFLVVWGWFTLGEVPTAGGLLGILLSLAGVYLLNATRRQVNWLAPLRALVTDRGQLFTLASAFFFAPSVVFIKQAALHSDPYFGTFIGYVFASSMLTPFVLYKSGSHFRRIGSYWMEFAGLGLFAALSSVMGTMAYTLTLSSYVEAVKQIEIIFALAVGYLFFNERATVKAIWPGALLIFAGVILLKLWG